MAHALPIDCSTLKSNVALFLRMDDDFDWLMPLKQADNAKKVENDTASGEKNTVGPKEQVPGKTITLAISYLFI